MRRRLGLILGPFLFFAVLLPEAPEGLSPEGHKVLAVAVWMAVWWLSEAIPIPATALLPLVLFPLSGTASAAQVSPSYMDRNVILFMGGFFLAEAIRRWGLHRRIALLILSKIGSNPPRLVLGFMLATAFLSMWVSNTATTIMMLPIALAVLSRLEEGGGKTGRASFDAALMLGIGYAASIGGVATLIGTPPNVVLATQYSTLFPGRPEIGFADWFVVGFPLTVLFLPLSWLYLVRIHRLREMDASGPAGSHFESERSRLGMLSRGEKMTAVVFVLMALGWIFRGDIDVGFWVIPGWSSLLGLKDFAHDSTVAMIGAVLLFALPVNWRKGEFLLDWETARGIPWGILVLLGGGIALAGQVRSSGLAEWIGGGLQSLAFLPLPLLILAICLLMTFLTEITSNTATATLFMPVMAGLAISLELDPLLLMVPAAISASYAFMLPVATPPNAIVFGSGRITMAEMSRAGLALNLLGAIVTAGVVYLWSLWVL